MKAAVVKAPGAVPDTASSPIRLPRKATSWWSLSQPAFIPSCVR